MIIFHSSNILLLSLCLSQILYAASNTLVDSRDGRRYKTIKIDKQVWMAENLKYKVSPSYCFRDIESNCQKYGRMYPWHVAMKLPAKKAYDNENVTNYVNSVHQGLCPAGWHVPSAADFDTLYAHAYDESPSTRKLSTDPAERFILNPKGFNLKYAGQLMIWGYEYYMGYKEIDPTAGARFFRTGKRGEYPLSFVYKDFNHFVSFTTTDAEESTVLVYAVYSDQYNFSMGANRIYRGASAEYLRCIKDFECPKGEEFYEGICQKPFDCSEYEYAVDKWNCEMLPDNAHRNKGLGFACDKGFDKVKEDDEYVCKKRAICDEYEYAVDKWNCRMLPDNAHKNKGIGFACDKGYDKVEKDENYACLKPYDCDTNEYVISKYECGRIPKNAKKVNSKSFSCNDGFELRLGLHGEPVCRSPFECEATEYAIDEHNCAKLPVLAHRNEKDGFSCDEGAYERIDEKGRVSCEILYECDSTEYAVDEYNCAPLPDYSHRNKQEGFTCDSGFTLYNGECCIVY